jgi:hypothetical protein
MQFSKMLRKNQRSYTSYRNVSRSDKASVKFQNKCVSTSGICISFYTLLTATLKGLQRNDETYLNDSS